jgi:hypothetical protein
MGVCDNCGNNYNKAFTVQLEEKNYTFDSFECAINQLAPRCNVCDTRIIGHGVESGGIMFCCSHCANHGTK